MQANTIPIQVYFIPGQGADERLFKNIDLNENFEVKYIHYFTPKSGTSLAEFAKELSKQIDTSKPFVLVGVSLGGMIATEMSQFLHPLKTVIISSAKNKNELPKSYTFQSKYPIYKLVSPKMAKFGAKILQPIVEPDRKKEKETCKSMLAAKDPLFLRRTIEMIITWDRTESPNDIVHIHGKKDNTIPFRNVNCNYQIVNGSHMMTLTRGKEISDILNKELFDTAFSNSAISKTSIQN